MNINLKIPNHIAFIMDGNGRWAKERGKSRTNGHKEGFKKINLLIDLCLKYNIKEVSVYAFSTENWNRPKDEVDYLFKYLDTFFDEFIKSDKKDKVKIRIIGEEDRLNDKTLNIIKKVQDITKDNEQLYFNIALNYGGKSDIIYGIKQLFNHNVDINSLTFEQFKRYCYSGELSDIDVLVRTGREKRISNFMPLQVLYSELIFDDLLWPDFNEDFFVKVLKEYTSRDRRFGGIKE